MGARNSLIGQVRNLVHAPIPFATRWQVGGDSGYYANAAQDRFTQLQTTISSGTLYAIVQLLSTGQAKSVWHMYRVDKDGRVRYAAGDQGSDMRVEVLQHQALRLWNKPNDFMTGFAFREIGWQFMELVGEWYWVMARGSSGTSFPTEIWPVRPDRMTPIPDRDNFLHGWVYTAPSGEIVPLTTNEVIQLRYPDPANMYRGLSPVQSILSDIDSSKYTAEWSRNFFLNSAVPGGIVTFAKRLSDEEFDEFTDRWREQHQGVARGHRVGVLEQGATWNQNTYTMRDMQFVDLRKMNRDVIREAYRIHQAMLGNSDDVNRANAQTAEEVHVAWHEIPRLQRTRDVLNFFYLPTFGNTGSSVEFDFDDPTPTSPVEANEELTAKSTAASVLVDSGYDPRATLEVVGLPPIEYIGPQGALQTPAATGAAGNMTDQEAQQAAQAIRAGVRGQLTNGISDQEARAIAEMIRGSFALNGNGHKELV